MSKREAGFDAIALRIHDSAGVKLLGGAVMGAGVSPFTIVSSHARMQRALLTTE
jgi:hypothetical protein